MQSQRRCRHSVEESAVSEIIGVVMLLVMVVTLLSGVLVMLKPYLDDLSDNKDWRATQTVSKQLNERLQTVAPLPEGIGVMVSTPLAAASLRPSASAETWEFQAGLTDTDVIQVDLTNGYTLNLTSVDGTPSWVQINSGNEIINWTLVGSPYQAEFVHSSVFESPFIATVYDSAGTPIHRLVRISLDGLRLDATLATGDYGVILVNGAMVEHLPDESHKVSIFPKLTHEQLENGGVRVTLVLLDVIAPSSLPSGGDVILEMRSSAQIELFNSEVHDLRFDMQSNIDLAITHAYMEHWTGEWDLWQAMGRGNEYHGFGPANRLSGSSGLTIHPHTDIVEFTCLYQQVEVQS